MKLFVASVILINFWMSSADAQLFGQLKWPVDAMKLNPLNNLITAADTEEASPIKRWYRSISASQSASQNVGMIDNINFNMNNKALDALMDKIDKIRPKIVDEHLNDYHKFIRCPAFNSASDISYPEIGSFGPKSSVLKHLCTFPSTPEECGVSFRIYHRDNPRLGYVIDEDGDKMTRFKSASRVAFLFHGFTKSGRHQLILRIKDAILSHDTSYDSAIVINYAKAISGPNYLRASTNSEIVGRIIGYFIKNLVEKRNFNPSKDGYFISFSLGVQISHFAAKYLFEKSNQKIYRITALDPAAPLTEGCEECPINTKYAHFVDVIHSASGFDPYDVVPSYADGLLSPSRPMGHVDFYPSGGASVKYCYPLNGAKKPLIVNCRHNMAPRYLVKSFKCSFNAVKCRSVNTKIDGANACEGPAIFPTQKMGFYADKHDARGSFYVHINGVNGC